MNEEFNWEKLCKTGGIAAFVVVFIILIQIGIFVVFPKKILVKKL